MTTKVSKKWELGIWTKISQYLLATDRA